MAIGQPREPEPYIVERESEEPKVQAWREMQLVTAGCTAAEALLLARSDADLHIALKLLRDGCPSARVVDILT